MRKTDPKHQKKRFFRANDRFFQINGQWYFSAREGDIGPFRSRSEAQREAEAYIAACEISAEGRPMMVEPTVIPGHLYRSVLSLAEKVDFDASLVLDVEELE